MNAAVEVPPPKTTGRRRVLPMRLRTPAYLIAGCALLIGLLATSFMQATTGFTALNQIRLANERADHLDNLQKLLLDMETATRGYLLTFDANFLLPYYTAVPKVPQILKVIIVVRLKPEQIQLIADVALIGFVVAARKGLLDGHFLEKGERKYL